MLGLRPDKPAPDMTCALPPSLPSPKTMLSRKKALLLLLVAFSTGTLLLRHSAHLSW